MSRRSLGLARLSLATAIAALALWLALGPGGGTRDAAVTAAVGDARDVEVAAAAGDVPAAAAPGGSFEPRSPAPVDLSAGDALEVGWRKPPRAALVFDVDSGAVLLRRRPRRVLAIASLTKIMTALTVTASTRPREPVRIAKDLRYEGSAVGLLPRGRRVRLEPLLAGLMLVSGNDAAQALARHVAGDERRFVALMNERARLWDLRCTRFASADGLDDGNRSCAADLAVLTRLAMRDRRIARIARLASASYRFPIRGRRLYLTGHNPLIRSGYRGAIGLKTGYTAAAGRCFVGVARRGGRTLGVVLLDSPDPGRQAATLLDRAFAATR